MFRKFEHLNQTIINSHVFTNSVQFIGFILISIVPLSSPTFNMSLQSFPFILLYGDHRSAHFELRSNRVRTSNVVQAGEAATWDTASHVGVAGIKSCLCF